MALRQLAAAVALVAVAGGAPAQFVPAVTGPRAVVVPAYTPATSYLYTDPYTGTVTRTLGAVDPRTGTYTQVGTSYNPATGVTVQNRQAFNPYTGTTVVGSRAVGPFGGVVNRLTGGNLYTGQAYAYPGRIPGFGRFTR